MAEYLDALLGVSGVLPLIGDDDGGRLFHPYGERARFGLRDDGDVRSPVAAAGVAARPGRSGGAGGMVAGCRGVGRAHDGRRRRASRDCSPTAGTAIMASGEVQLVIKAGPFGEGSGGHSHSDVLSLTARVGCREILIDPGTFTYVADPVERNRFRGSAAHNTVRIDGRDQAVPGGPFRWNDKPSVKVREWATGAERDYLDATCAYAGFTHRRRVVFLKPAHGDRAGYGRWSAGRSYAGAVLASGLARKTRRASASVLRRRWWTRGGRARCAAGSLPRCCASRCRVRCRFIWRQCWISRRPR